MIWTNVCKAHTGVNRYEHVSFATRVSVYYTNSSVVRVRNIIASTVLRSNQVCTNL